MLGRSINVLSALSCSSRQTARLALLALVLPDLASSPAQDARFEAARGALLAGIATPRGCSLLSIDARVATSRRPVLDEDDVDAALPAGAWALRGTARHWTAHQGAASRSPSQVGRGSSLLATSSARIVETHNVQKEPLPAGWFGDFSQSESTWRTDGVGARPDYPEHQSGEDTVYAATADEEEHISMPTAKPGKWFQETESAGSKRAWQTYYPSVGNFRSRDQQLAPWRGSAEGTFQEEYEPDEKVQGLYADTKAKDPVWFDSSVSQYDAFGRGKLPGKDSQERHVEFTQRSRNITFACRGPGCEVNASLKVFDHDDEAHQDCKLTIRVHPTDFDDEFSREYMELVSLNDRALNFRCRPQAEVRTCGADGEGALAHCMKDFPLERIVSHDGMLHMTTRISPMVDECPVKGNLLSGMAIVTCMVHPSWLNQPKNETRWRTTTTPPDVTVGRLQCREPNCSATTTIFVDPLAAANKTCRLTVSMAETDFDGNLGSIEEVEWVKIDGQPTQAFRQPSRNPCKERLKGNSSNSSGKDSHRRRHSSQSNSSHGGKERGGHSGSHNNTHGNSSSHGNSSHGKNSSHGNSSHGNGNSSSHNSSSHNPGSHGNNSHGNSSSGDHGHSGNHSHSNSSHSNSSHDSGGSKAGNHSSSSHGSSGSHGSKSSGSSSEHTQGKGGSGQHSGDAGFAGAQLSEPNASAHTNSSNRSSSKANASGAESSTNDGEGGKSSGNSSHSHSSHGKSTNSSDNSSSHSYGSHGNSSHSSGNSTGNSSSGRDSHGSNSSHSNSSHSNSSHSNSSHSNSSGPTRGTGNATGSGSPLQNSSNTSDLGGTDGIPVNSTVANATYPDNTTTTQPSEQGTGNASNATPSVVDSVFGNAFGNLHSHQSSTVPIPDTVYGDEGARFGEAQFILVNGSDVTAAAVDGQVTVSVKITGMVDECGTEEGYLLDAQAMIECT